MIAGEIRRYLRDNSAVRVSRSMRDTAYKVLQIKEKLTAEQQREPDITQIAKALDIPTQEVYFALDAISEPVSIYEPVFSDGGESICVMDQIGDEHNTDDAWIERLSLSEAMNALDDRAKSASSRCAFTTARRRWRWRPKSVSARRRFRGSKKTRSSRSKRG